MTVRALHKLAATFIACLACSGAAHAYWNLDKAPSTTIGDSSSSTYTVKMSGFYVSNATSAGKLSGKWSSGALNQFAGSGQGMYTGTDSREPYHALDNSENTEAVLLSFSASTVLTSIGLGYTATTPYSTNVEYGCVKSGAVVSTVIGSASCPSGTTKNSSPTVDISLFRWTGTDAPPSLTTTTAGTMDGWELVGNYGDLIKDTSNPYNLVNGEGKTSSWWLITAYNSGFTQSAGAENRGTLTNGDDFFKLYAVAGSKCTSTVGSNGVCGGSNSSVPEPATLALASVALVGVAGLRRRRGKLAA